MRIKDGDKPESAGAMVGLTGFLHGLAGIGFLLLLVLAAEGVVAGFGL